MHTYQKRARPSGLLFQDRIGLWKRLCLYITGRRLNPYKINSYKGTRWTVEE